VQKICKGLIRFIKGLDSAQFLVVGKRLLEKGCQKTLPGTRADFNLINFARTGGWPRITSFSHAITHTDLLKSNKVWNHV
jgi:hypothetical protein